MLGQLLQWNTEESSTTRILAEVMEGFYLHANRLYSKIVKCCNGSRYMQRVYGPLEPFVKFESSDQVVKSSNQNVLKQSIKYLKSQFVRKGGFYIKQSKHLF